MLGRADQEELGGSCTSDPTATTRFMRPATTIQFMAAVIATHLVGSDEARVKPLELPRIYLSSSGPTSGAVAVVITTRVAGVIHDSKSRVEVRFAQL